MQNYQLTLLIKDQVKEESRKGLFDDLKKNFSNLIKEDLWGVRSLSYPIKHIDKAFYAHFEFEAEPESVITLDKNIRLNEDIIRYLIVKQKITKKKKEVKKKKVEVEAKPEKVEEKIETKAKSKE